MAERTGVVLGSPPPRPHPRQPTEPPLKHLFFVITRRILQLLLFRKYILQLLRPKDSDLFRNYSKRAKRLIQKFDSFI